VSSRSVRKQWGIVSGVWPDPKMRKKRPSADRNAWGGNTRIQRPKCQNQQHGYTGSIAPCYGAGSCRETAASSAKRNVVVMADNHFANQRTCQKNLRRTWFRNCTTKKPPSRSTGRGAKLVNSVRGWGPPGKRAHSVTICPPPLERATKLTKKSPARARVVGHSRKYAAGTKGQLAGEQRNRMKRLFWGK